MQQLYGFAFASLGGALVLLGGYHYLVVGPRLRRLAQASTTHDELLGAGGGAASSRLSACEAGLHAADERSSANARRLDDIERTLRSDVHRVGFVRYNAFSDVGSELSFALALLNREGDGVVVSSIFSREETRTYGKAVERFATVVDASAEELKALERARAAV